MARVINLHLLDIRLTVSSPLPSINDGADGIRIALVLVSVIHLHVALKPCFTRASVADQAREGRLFVGAGIAGELLVKELRHFRVVGDAVHNHNRLHDPATVILP